MPGKLSKGDEKMWQKAKSVVRKQRDKKKSKFTDKDWGLVQHIFSQMKKSKAELLHSLVVSANMADTHGNFELTDNLDAVLEMVNDI